MQNPQRSDLEDKRVKTWEKVKMLLALYQTGRCEEERKDWKISSSNTSQQIRKERWEERRALRDQPQAKT
jgi:hypothetical protein